MISQVNFSNSSFNEDLILQALAASPAPTSIYSGENMIIRFANAGMLALWGKNSSVIGKPLLEAIPELEGQPFLEILREVWHSGKTYSVSEAPAKLIINGEERLDYFDYEYKALTEHTGKTWCILNTALNVTARREFLMQIAEKEERENVLTEEMAATLEELTSTNEELSDSIRELAYSREYINTIITQAPVGIAMLKGPEHIIEIANPAILNIWGRTASEVIGHAHEKARPELKGQPVNLWLHEVYATGKPKINTEFAVRLLNHTGGLRDAIVNSVYQPIFSDNGSISGVLVILEEITQQVVERRKNENDQQMLALAINAGELATFYYQPATNLFSGNELLKKWFGLSTDEHLDLSLALAAIVPEDRDRVTEAIQSSLSQDSNGIYSVEYRIQNNTDRTIRLLQANGRVFYNPDGKPLSLNGTLRDITEQKKEEQRKDDFMGVVSHELKTPLTSLKAYIQLLQRMVPADSDKQQSMLEKSVKQVDYMNNMINGFLNVSRLDSGQMYIEKTEFDLQVLFREVEHEVLSTNHTRNFIFKATDPVSIVADRDKISQVLHNLIGNAIKYSSVNTVITVEYRGTAQNTVQVNVHDNGIGIAHEDQDRIFERYYRVKDINSRTVAGFGIGLYLCREIIELHHGTVSVNSSSDQGTTFSFVLPIDGKEPDAI